MTERPPFHLAIPVNDLEAARHFYHHVLECPEGRSDARWVDFDFFGHQLVAHLADVSIRQQTNSSVDHHDIPVPHFGVVLSMAQWQTIVEKLKANQTPFVVEPHIRFKGQAGEQATAFIQDPAGNVLELKAFDRLDQLFVRD